MRFLVTAGNTRERIDRVRDWGNLFTGNTGFAIAKALAELGEVDLLTSNQNHLEELKRLHAAPHAIVGRHFTSHADLRAGITERMSREKYDAVFMTAAVADYAPVGAFHVIDRTVLNDGRQQWIVEDVSAGKVKSSYPQVAFLGAQTEKLVDLFRGEFGYAGLLVKFKLEVDVTIEQLLEIAGKSRIASGADYIVANTLEMVQGDRPGAYLIGLAGHEWITRDQLPAKVAGLIGRSIPPSAPMLFHS